MTKGATKTLGEAIQDVSWRDGTTRFVIHATDVIPPEFDIENPDRENDYAYTVAKLNNCNAYLINLGTNLNKDVLNQLVEAIKEANGTEKGTFFNNNPIITAMNNAADYIIGIAKKLSKPVDWVLVNTEILWNTEYDDILGHTNASFTLDTYTHVTPDMQQEASHIVGGFLEDLLGKDLKPWQRNRPEGGTHHG